MNKKFICYARVSSRDQNKAKQIIALIEYDVPPNSIFADHQNGKNFEKNNYKRMLKRLKKSDILVIKSIDKLRQAGTTKKLLDNGSISRKTREQI